jgi:two-component system, response regulator PdtaR
MSKIMIVDNDVTVQMDLAEYFKFSDHHLVGIAESEEETLEMVKKTRPDIILMEIDLPEKRDGIDVAKRIRKEMDVGIIFMTVYSNPGFIERAKHVAPLAYVFKPFCEREIKAAIEIGLYHQKITQTLQADNRRLERRVVEQEIALASIKNDSAGHPLTTPMGYPIPVGQGDHLNGECRQNTASGPTSEFENARISTIGLKKWRFIP